MGRIKPNQARPAHVNEKVQLVLLHLEWESQGASGRWRVSCMKTCTVSIESLRFADDKIMLFHGFLWEWTKAHVYGWLFATKSEMARKKNSTSKSNVMALCLKCRKSKFVPPFMWVVATSVNVKMSLHLSLTTEGEIEWKIDR